MRQWRHPYLSFQHGEVSISMLMRRDTRRYPAVALSLLNTHPVATGAVRRRMGTRFRRDMGNVALARRMAPFEFDSNELNLLVFDGDGMLTVLDELGESLGTAPVTVGPWGGAALRDMDMVQSLNTMIMVNQRFWPRRLVRTALDTFALEPLAFEEVTTANGTRIAQPHVLDNQGIELDPNGTSGTITITASAPFWRDDSFSQPQVGYQWLAQEMPTHVGQRFRLKGREVEITEVLSATQARAAVRETLQDANATLDWTMQLYSGTRGFPRAVCIHAERLWLGGGGLDPNLLVASKIGAFFNFELGEGEDDDGISYRLGGESVNRIEYIIDGPRLQVFTDKRFFAAPGLVADNIRPSDFALRGYDRIGSWRVRPAIYDGATVTVDASGRALRDVIYNDQISGFEAGRASLLAPHLVKQPVAIAEIPETGEYPEQLLGIVNADGTMAVHHAMRSEDVLSWRPWETDGSFIDICRLGDRAFVLVEREIGGVTRCYLESFEATAPLDCAIPASNDAHALNLAYLEGKEVQVSASRFYVGKRTVSGGAGAFPTNWRSDHVGLGFIARITPMEIDAILQQFVMHGEPKRLVKMDIEVERMVHLQVNDGVRTRRLGPQGGQLVSLDPVPFTGLLTSHMLGIRKSPRISLEMPFPTPGTVLGYTQEIMI